MNIRIGTSGWSYDHWQGRLYPEQTPVGKRLPYYLNRYDTVEINSTYYRWPRDQTFIGWHDKLPDGFVMSVKAPRGLTHYARLYEPEAWLSRIQAGIACLGDRMGVFLVQLPPQFARDDARLDYFLSAVPVGLNVTVEFRHPSWHNDTVLDMLERHGAAYCVMSGAELPCILRATAPFVYVRFHGPDHHTMYAGSYSDADLQWWAERMREWEAGGKTVFGYFNNDGNGYALDNADTLKRQLGI